MSCFVTTCMLVLVALSPEHIPLYEDFLSAFGVPFSNGDVAFCMVQMNFWETRVVLNVGSERTRVVQAKKCRKIMVRLRAERKQKVLNVSVKMQSLACFGPNRAGKINETYVLFVSQSGPKIQPLFY